MGGAGETAVEGSVACMPKPSYTIPLGRHPLSRAVRMHSDATSQSKRGCGLWHDLQWAPSGAVPARLVAHRRRREERQKVMLERERRPQHDEPGVRPRARAARAHRVAARGAVEERPQARVRHDDEVGVDHRQIRTVLVGQGDVRLDRGAQVCNGFVDAALLPLCDPERGVRLGVWILPECDAQLPFSLGDLAAL